MDKFYGGIFCPSTISLDGDILLMHCQMQTGFLIQVILHLLYATLVHVYANENQSKILTHIKRFPVYLQYFDNKVAYQPSSCKKMGAPASDKQQIDETSGNKQLLKHREEYLQLWPVLSPYKSNKFKARCNICNIDFSVA